MAVPGLGAEQNREVLRVLSVIYTYAIKDGRIPKLFL